MAMTPTAAGGASADPTAAAGAGADPSADAGASDETTVCTICMASDGTYTVYAGDEPDDSDGGDGAGMSEDDDAAMGGAAGGAGAPASPAPAGQHADSIGQALKIAMDVLNAAASSAGGEGSADDQFASGFNDSGAPTPATVRR